MDLTNKNLGKSFQKLIGRVSQSTDAEVFKSVEKFLNRTLLFRLHLFARSESQDLI